MTIKQKRSLHRDWIDRDAYKIVQQLQDSGFTAYLVGGCVRDLLVNLPPKDFDIVSDASPQEVKRNVRNAYIIGKRFRLVLVYRFKKVFEVATFRREATIDEMDSDEIGSLDNFFGTPEEDAHRRDFTVNAIFYDCVNDDVIDLADGLKDIDAKMIRMLGDPDERLVEDPIRILRAIRLSHKLSFQIEESLRDSIYRNALELKNAALPRVREEFLKILKLESPFEALTEAYDLGVLQVCMPTFAKLWENAEQLEMFRQYLCQRQYILSPESEPAEDLAFIIYAYLKVLGEQKKFSAILNDFKDCKHTQFFKQELFLFNAEAVWVRKLFLMLEKLEKTSFEATREKAKRHMANQKHFIPAIKYAQLDYILPPSEVRHWLVYLA